MSSHFLRSWQLEVNEEKLPGRGKSGGEIVEEGLELRRLKVRVDVVMKVPIGDGYRESRGSR